jgi:hypothetical protein
MGLRPKQLEAVGVLIVLFAALWEIMTLREILGWLNEWQFSQLNWRITHIWSAIGTVDPHAYVSSQSEIFYNSHNYIDRIDEWKEKFLFSLQSNIRTGLYLLGSACVVIGKWRDGAPSKT